MIITKPPRKTKLIDKIIEKGGSTGSTNHSTIDSDEKEVYI